MQPHEIHAETDVLLQLIFISYHSIVWFIVIIAQNSR